MMNAIRSAAVRRPHLHRCCAESARGAGRAGRLELLEARRLLSGEPGAESVVFVGVDVADREGVAAIFADADVVFLEGGRGAIDQVSEMLAGRRGLGSVQFFTHGLAGALLLGGATLDSVGLAALAEDVAGWGKALAPDGDILLCGCGVGAGAAGEMFVQALAHLTGADVAASTDVTGAKSLGGDWVLERTTGQVTARIDGDGYRGTLGGGPPDISGTESGQMVDDNGTIVPFDNVQIVEPGGNPFIITLTIDDPAKGAFTPESLAMSGFTDEGGGVYTYTAVDFVAADQAMSALVFAPTANRVAVGMTETTTITIMADDGVDPVSVDSNTTIVSTSINDAPEISGMAAGQAVNDTGTILPFAGVTISDPDVGNDVLFVITLDDEAKGAFTQASLDASGFMGDGMGVYQFTGSASALTTAIRLLAFDPANNRVAPGMTEITSMSTLAHDGTELVLDNTTTVVSTSVNDAPTLSAIDTLNGAAARQALVIAYADLLAASDAADADPGAVLLFRVESVGSGQLLMNGTPVTPGVTTLAAGETFEWRPAAGAGGATTAFTVVASDGTMVSGAAAVNANVTPVDPNTAAEGGNVSIATDGAGLTTVATRNDAGRLIVLQQEGAEGTWDLVDLSGVPGIATILGDPQVFVDPTGANSAAHVTYVAVTTNAGLLLVWDDEGTWTSRNLSSELSTPAITGDLITFTTIDGRQVLAGFSAGGDLVINFQGAGIEGPGEAAWQGTNLYEVLRNQSESTPAFASTLTPYVTSWNGLNIAGLDADGNIWTVWTGGGIEAWHSTNISGITGAPALVGGLGAYTTSWGGINLTGIDTNGDLTVSWWVPQFGGNWVNTNMTTAFGGPDLRAGSVTAYVTPWSSLNITGLNEDGDVVQYWWVPPPQPDMWYINNLTEGQPMSVPRFAGRLAGLATVDSRLNVVGQSEDGHILRAWWSPTTEWELEDLTALV